MNEDNKISEKQERFMWMAHVEGKKFIDIAELLNVEREHISIWEKDLKPHWEKLSELKKLYNAKKLKHDVDIIKFPVLFDRDRKVEEYLADGI